MKTVSEIVLDKVESTRRRFYQEMGKRHTNEKRAFINWYVANHQAPLEVLLHDLSNYFLHIEESTIMIYLNEKE